MWIKKWFDHVDYDPHVGDYVGYDDYDDSPTPIGVKKVKEGGRTLLNNFGLTDIVGESISYSMGDLVYMAENIMKNLRK
jgi:hypothetical protein